MKKRDNFTTLGHYGGVSVSYLSRVKQLKSYVKKMFYSIFI